MAVAFTVLSILETQDKAIWASSPWKDDPYHTAVFLAPFAVAMLTGSMAVRLLARSASGGSDRTRQMVRAAAAVTTLVGATLGAEWVAVGVSPRDSRSGAQVWGLLALTALTAVVTGLLVRCRVRGGWSVRWQHDWLDDLVFLCRGVPVLRDVASDRSARWARRHAMGLFVTVSVLAGAMFAGAQAVGEAITDPLFVGWFLVVDAAANFAFCVLSNAFVGFIALRPRGRVCRLVETSVVAGCVATLLAVAFHDAVWSVLGAGTLTFSRLAALSLGAGLLTTVLVAAAMAPRPSPCAPHGRTTALSVRITTSA